MPYRFRRVRAPDLRLIGCWLATPHVRRWWGDPDRELALLEGDLDVAHIRHYIVSHRGWPFGFIQCVDPAPETAWGLPPWMLPGRGLDYFIGEAEMVSRGHGTGMLSAIAAAVFPATAAAFVFSDPDPENAASVGALRAAGFVHREDLMLPEGLARIMVRTR